MKRIVKRKGHFEAYNRKKLYESVYAAALSVREVPEIAHQTADAVTTYVEEWIGEKHEVTSADLRRKAGEKLKDIHADAAQVYNHHRIIWE